MQAIVSLVQADRADLHGVGWGKRLLRLHCLLRGLAGKFSQKISLGRSTLGSRHDYKHLVNTAYKSYAC